MLVKRQEAEGIHRPLQLPMLWDDAARLNAVPVDKYKVMVGWYIRR